MTSPSQGYTCPKSAHSPANPAESPITADSIAKKADLCLAELEAVAHGFEAVAVLLQKTNDLTPQERYCLGALLEYLSWKQQDELTRIRAGVKPSSAVNLPTAPIDRLHTLVFCFEAIANLMIPESEADYDSLSVLLDSLSQWQKQAMNDMAGIAAYTNAARMNSHAESYPTGIDSEGGSHD